MSVDGQIQILASNKIEFYLSWFARLLKLHYRHIFRRAKVRIEELIGAIHVEHCDHLEWGALERRPLHYTPGGDGFD